MDFFSLKEGLDPFQTPRLLQSHHDQLAGRPRSLLDFSTDRAVATSNKAPGDGMTRIGIPILQQQSLYPLLASKLRIQKLRHIAEIAL